MIGRCYTTSNPDYGGRGIAVCERWHEFEAFYEDMGDRPAGHSIERQNPNGNYEPGNCSWLPTTKQARNTRRTVWVTLNGERLNLAEACERLGRVRGTVWGWLKRSKVPVGIDLALTT